MSTKGLLKHLLHVIVLRTVEVLPDSYQYLKMLFAPGCVFYVPMDIDPVFGGGAQPNNAMEVDPPSQDDPPKDKADDGDAMDIDEDDDEDDDANSMDIDNGDTVMA
ncbi:hypothetical protein LXA43DRAFT_1100189 [Ganoderma leucocontextum]|nr:hypothetical protein LXA43DRAFT_1100189 [Ganoderma leucocontextum]